ncbi:MAG: hypothetical protein M5R38_09955 [Candidatus Methylomirabilis sp.]|nr:hypothetical protein [Candidatus Methylomirabilis sp.]
MVRIEPTYGYGKATDLYGNKSSHRWDPRCCQKGLVLARRLYGDRRIDGALIRRGFKEWVDKGFPRDPKTGAAPRELMQRGWDRWVRVSHEQAYAYHAKALHNIARTYSGEQGKAYLLAQGYDPDMVEQVGGAGTRVMKFRGGWRNRERCGSSGPFAWATAWRSLITISAASNPTRPRGRFMGFLLIPYRSAAGTPDGHRRPDQRL